MAWNIVSQIAIVVIGLFGGAATVPVIRWLKMKLNTDGGQTLALAAGFSVLLTLAAAIVEETITPGAITADNFGVLFLVLFAAGQARYRQLRDELGEV